MRPLRQALDLTLTFLLNEAIVHMGRNIERINKKCSGAFLGSLVNKCGEMWRGKLGKKSHNDLAGETAGC